MITSDNLKDVLESLPKADVAKVLNGNKDYVKLELHISNSGFSCSIEEVDYNEDEESDTVSNGNVYCDKDALLQLVEEVDVSFE